MLLELVLVFGLLSRRRWVLGATLLQLGLFHLTSFPIVGFFYPLLMVLLLAVFPLSHLIPESRERGEGSRWSVLAVQGVFSVQQLVPHLLPGDPVLTGQGRAMALHMFDAPVACRAVATVHRRGKPPSPMAMTARLPLRIACDPLVYWNFAVEICRQQVTDATFVDLDLLLESRHGSGGALVRVVDVPRFCTETPSYELLGANPWIRGE